MADLQIAPSLQQRNFNQPSTAKNVEGGLSVAPTWAAAKEVDGRVVHEVPDAPANDALLALVHLGPLDEPLLQGAQPPPDDAVAAALLPVGAQDEARVVRAQRGREHAGAPRPVHRVGPQLGPEEVVLLVPVHQLVDLDDVLAGDEGLLLPWVGDLRDKRNGPVARSLSVGGNASVV